ncbi:MAG: DUF362 domain-containing protein [Candidatus Latescibacteria bacterium]|nr:DUF362 domain-containing protein [Candidatus Latescibacterota bacterium]
MKKNTYHIEKTEFHLNRRSFFRDLSLGAAGLFAGSTILKQERAFAENKSSGKSRVSFVTGNDRREMIYKTMEPFKKEIAEQIRGKQVIIKPNNVWHGNPLCATHPDAIRGALDFLKPLCKNTIFIAESTASPEGTEYTFEEYGYTPLEKEYNAKLVDLNKDNSSTQWILSEQRHPLDIEIIDTFLNPDNFIISLARMKTHNCVVATLAFKNMLLASPINVGKNHPNFVKNQFEKAKMHQGGPNGINYNMFLLAHKVRPNFAIIDGTVGMQGNGPNDGTPVEHGVALAGPDVVAVDRVGIELMEINYEDVGYLQWCAEAGIGEGDLSNISVMGPDIATYSTPYKLHENIEWQLTWKNT